MTADLHVGVAIGATLGASYLKTMRGVLVLSGFNTYETPRGPLGTAMRGLRIAARAVAHGLFREVRVSGRMQALPHYRRLPIRVAFDPSSVYPPFRRRSHS